jgi:hypothetical protein
MYEGVVYVGGAITKAGADTVVSEATADERSEIAATLSGYGIKGPDSFRKIVSGRRLWNYDRRERGLWAAAL